MFGPELIRINSLINELIENARRFFLFSTAKAARSAVAPSSVEQ